MGLLILNQIGSPSVFLDLAGFEDQNVIDFLDRVEPEEETLAPLADPLQEIELLGAEDELLEEPLAEIAPQVDEIDEQAAEAPADLELLESDAELPVAADSADGFTFELAELDELPSLQDDELAPAALIEIEAEPELEELSLEQLSETPQWDELELADLELPEVELPSAPEVAPYSAVLPMMPFSWLLRGTSAGG